MPAKPPTPEHPRDFSAPIYPGPQGPQGKQGPRGAPGTPADMAAVAAAQAAADAAQATADAAQAGAAQALGSFVSMKEPTGFQDRATTTLTLDAGTRTLTLAPTGANFEVYIQGTPFTKTAETVVWTDVDGIHIFYYDNAGVLTSQAGAVLLDVIFASYAVVSLLFWDATNNVIVYGADERHGLTMDWAVHGHLHQTLGTQWVSGLALSSIVADGTGGLATDAEIAVDTGLIRDEDLAHTISAIALPAALPVLYRSGASGVWHRKAATAYPVIHSGTVVGYGGTRLAWNEYTGGAWQLTQVTSGRYVLAHIVATNDLLDPVMAIAGIAEYGSLNAARAGATAEATALVLTTIFSEFVVLGTIIYQTSDAYANVPKARVRATAEGAAYVDFRTTTNVSASAPTVHANLAGLAADDHPQYLLAASTAIPSLEISVGNALNGTDALSCEILDPGDGSGIAAALSTAASNPSRDYCVQLDGGGYALAAGAPTLTVPANASVRGFGPSRGSITTCAAVAVAAQGVVVESGGVLEDTAIVIAPNVAGAVASFLDAYVEVNAGAAVRRLQLTVQPSAEFLQFIVLGNWTLGSYAAITVEDISITGPGACAGYPFIDGVLLGGPAPFTGQTQPTRISRVQADFTGVTGTSHAVRAHRMFVEIDDITAIGGSHAVLVAFAESTEAMSIGPVITNVFHDQRGAPVAAAPRAISLSADATFTGTIVGTRVSGIRVIPDANSDARGVLSFSGGAFGASVGMVISDIVCESLVAGVGGFHLGTSGHAFTGTIVTSINVGLGDVELITSSAVAGSFVDTLLNDIRCRNFTVGAGSTRTRLNDCAISGVLTITAGAVGTVIGPNVTYGSLVDSGTGTVNLAQFTNMAANTVFARQTGVGAPTALAATVSPSTLGTDPTGALAHYPAVQAEWGRISPSHGTRRASVYATDFASWISASVGANEGGYVPATNGTGSSISIGAGIAGRIGLASIYAGTASTGRSAVYLNDALCLFGGGTHRYQCEHKLFSLSDGTNTYTAWFGWINTANSASTPTNGAFFRYTHGTNSGKYQCVTVSAGAENATDSGITASISVYHDMEIEVNAAATSVRFWVDGVLVGTHSTAANIPTATGRECGPAIKIMNSLGTAGVRATFADWLAYRFDPTTAR